MNQHTVEKIGGTSMSNYAAVRDNVVLQQGNLKNLYQRVFVVSAYAGITDMLLEHKKSGEPGIYALFAAAKSDDRGWKGAFDLLRERVHNINAELFGEGTALTAANQFIDERLDDAEGCLRDLERLCQHGHFALATHLHTVREMLASIGEAHSARNMAELLKRDGVNARFIDLSGWKAAEQLSLDDRVLEGFEGVNLETELPIVTGYTHAENGLMATFDRGYSEMTFSRVAVLTNAREAVIHKEFHLSSADPRLAGEDNVVPIGRTNYDVADQLANLGMEAIHPRAAKGLRQQKIALRVKNTFEPEHDGTLITSDYISKSPRVEIIAGRKNVFAIEVFDQDMMGSLCEYDTGILEIIGRFKAEIITKDSNANSITHFLAANLKTVKRIKSVLEEEFPESEVELRKVAIVSAIGSDMKVPGILAQAVTALAEANISVEAMHQSMRQVDMQFVVNEDDYELAVKSLHHRLVEVHKHGGAICAA